MEIKTSGKKVGPLGLGRLQDEGRFMKHCQL